jgi:hypothetical protein
LPWLAVRRSWRALGAAVASAVALTLAMALVVGWMRFIEDLEAWRAVATAGWPARRANQSLVAMWGRFLLGEGPGGYPIVTPRDVWVLVAAAATAMPLLVPLAVVAARHRLPGTAAEQLACLGAVAVLMSPIAWEHYWVAWFPVFLALHLRVRRDRAPWLSGVFWAGAILVTGVSAATAGSEAVRTLRAGSAMTLGGVVTCAALLWTLYTRSHRRTAQG